MRKQTMMMISDLSNDLEAEVLSRVPANYLWELKTTCKRWYSLFRDPWFIEKNKKLSKTVRETILHNNLRVYSIAGDLHELHNSSVEPSIEYTPKLKRRKGSIDLNFSNIYHCDSLMLCTTKTKGNTRLVVWNPCTGQTRLIEPRTCHGSNETYALGYSTSSSFGHSYKILRFWYYQNDQEEWVVGYEIYELSSDSWRVLDSVSLDCYLYCNGMSLKGDTYWVAGHEIEGTDFFLMKFDFTTEKFVSLPLPFQSFDREDTVVLSVVKDEKLSVLHQGILGGSNVMRIWVTNKVDKNLPWRSNFVLTVDFDKFDDVPCVVNVTSFLLDEENKVAVCCDKDPDDKDKTRIYVVGEDMYKKVYKDDATKATPFSWPHVLTYVPSLVQITKGCFYFS